MKNKESVQIEASEVSNYCHQTVHLKDTQNEHINMPTILSKIKSETKSLIKMVT